MSRWKPLGLIASGKLIDSPVARQPGLCRGLGPVTALNRRLASRYSNSLRAGHPAEAAELNECGLVLVQTEEQSLQRVVEVLEACGDWRGRHFALLSKDFDSSALCALKRRGAGVCSAWTAPGPNRDLLVVEGDTPAVRLVRDWAHEARLRCLQLAPGTKPLYNVALLSADALITPVMDGAMRALRAAGLDPDRSRRILTYMVESEVRAYNAHGRRSWSSPALPARRNSVRRQLRAAAALDPRLAGYVRAILEAALAHFSEPSDWLDDGEPADSGVLRSAAGIS